MIPVRPPQYSSSTWLPRLTPQFQHRRHRPHWSVDGDLGAITERVGNVLVRRLLIISACLIALLIGCSRTYLGLHWPSDVLGGWLLAATMVSVTMALVNLALIPYPRETVPDVHPGAIDDATQQLTLQQAGRADDSASSQLE